MKVWRLYWHDSAEGECVEWHSSRRNAEKSLTQLRRGHVECADEDDLGFSACGPHGIEAVDVPTDREGLLNFLNANFNRNNG